MPRGSDARTGRAAGWWPYQIPSVEEPPVTEVSVHGLTKRYGPRTAVDDVGFTLSPGRVIAFLGPNGAGKTTTARMILGLVRPTAGRALIDGRPYRELAEPKRAVGAVLESTGQHPGRSGAQHLRIAASAARLPVRRVAEVLDQVGLADAAGQRVRGYSLGMRQRLSLATALLGDPAALILDEPANGLDPAGTAWLRGLLRELAAEGRTVFVSSHVLAEITQLADRVVVIAAGRLRYDGPLDELAEAGRLEDAFLRLTTVGGER
jgi:ABC-2 type transport system ATP-binding protein